jgi:predicted dithiol-disulfide oxidoreductase (DUF899 family)
VRTVSAPTKRLTRRSDELARQRPDLPWVRIDKEYRAPRGRNEPRAADDPLNFFRRHDEYDSQTT